VNVTVHVPVPLVIVISVPIDEQAPDPTIVTGSADEVEAVTVNFVPKSAVAGWEAVIVWLPWSTVICTVLLAVV